MAKQIITGGDGQPGSQTGEEVKDMINENFTELYDDLADTEEFDPATKANVASPTFTGTVTIPNLKITGGSPGAGKVLTTDADGDVTAETPGSGSAGSIRLTAFEFFTDFINSPISSGSGVVGPSEAALILSGAGTAVSKNTTGAVANRPGVITLSTGTTNAGYLSVYAGAGLKLGGGAWVYEAAVRIPALSTGSERFIVKAGLYNETTTITELDAVSFVYDEGGVGTGSAASANWQLVTSNNSTRTYTTSSIAVAANTWTKLRIEVNAGGTSAQFFVDGVSAGTIATNLPGSTRNLVIAVSIMKSVGTTAVTADWDYMYANLAFTTSR